MNEPSQTNLSPVKPLNVILSRTSEFSSELRDPTKVEEEPKPVVNQELPPPIHKPVTKKSEDEEALRFFQLIPSSEDKKIKIEKVLEDLYESVRAKEVQPS